MHNRSIDSHSHSGNAAQRVIAGCHRLLMIDEEWTVRRPRGFSWLAHRLMQHVDASAPFEDVDMKVSRVHVRAHVLRDVKADDRTVSLFLSRLNRQAEGSAWLYDRETRTVSLGLASTVHDETISLREALIASYAILQLSEAEDAADELARALDAEVAVAQHPARGYRTVPDEMLDVGRTASHMAGGTSKYANEEAMRLVHEFVEATDGHAFSMGYSTKGIAFEVPFGPRDTALVELVTGAPHPRLGNGLIVLCRIRTQFSLDVAAERAHGLNQAAFADFSVLPLTGAWTIWNMEDKWSIAFNQFIPNMLYDDGMARDAAAMAMASLAILDRAWYPELEERTAAEIVARRIRSS